METIGLGTGQAILNIQIGAVWTKDFYFQNYNTLTEVYTDEDLTGATFSFFLKKNIGDYKKIFTLTLGSGIGFVTYYTNGIRLTISAVQTSIEEGEYYFELRRTDLDKAKLAGKAFLTFNAQ